jgi:hypothetical protein
MGGALIGGTIANQGQEDEREAVQRDVRRETYATYIQAAEDLVQKSANLNESGGLDTQAEISEFVEAEGVPVLTALAAVDLVAIDGEIRDAAHDITDALESERGITSEEEWERLKQNFIDLAQKDIFPGE